MAQPRLHERVSEFLDFWQAHAPEVRAEGVALALLSAAQVEAYHRQHQSMELVWTGPDSQVIPLRRTDQVLLQMIDGAYMSLHIVSFAVYKAEFVTQSPVRSPPPPCSPPTSPETP